jgi:hypothetical protein
MRRCFFIFDYDQDRVEAERIIGLGLVNAALPVPIDGPEAWNIAKSNGVDEVKSLIDRELAGTSAAVILIGSRTAGLGYVNYAIERAIRRRCGLLGIYISNPEGNTEESGAVPYQREAKALLEGQHYPVHEWNPDQFVTWVNDAATDWKSFVRTKPLNRIPPSMVI